MKKILIFALFGAVGFGIGGAILGGSVFLYQNFYYTYSARWAIELFAFGAKGWLGGMALGLALRKRKKELMLFGSGGFLVGGFLAVYWYPTGINNL